MWQQSPCAPSGDTLRPVGRRVASHPKPDRAKGGGAGGIRTLDRALQPYNGLANRRLQPLGHSSGRVDMPDAVVSRKRGFRSRDSLAPTEVCPEPLYIRLHIRLRISPPRTQRSRAELPRHAPRLFRAELLPPFSAVVGSAIGSAVDAAELGASSLSPVR